MSNLDDLSFSLEDDSPVQRSAFRATVSGLQVRLNQGSVLYDVHDISSAGFSMATTLQVYQAGDMLEVDLLAGRKVLLAGMQAQVVRLAPNGIVACAFASMTRYQETKLDKLMLEIQKRKIAQRKTYARQHGDDGETSGE